MRLFEIDETHNVRPNKVWIDLIPEFSAILRRDKGSKGDSQGRAKLRSRKELAYIYFLCDFGSPLRDWLPDEKRKEALYYAGLQAEEIDDVLNAAIAKYNELQNRAARSLRTFQAMNKGLDQLDAYLEAINFSDVDRKGELRHDPSKIGALMERMTGLYQKRRDFEKFVEDDLKANPEAIQGNRTLGDQEANKGIKVKEWSEADVQAGSIHVAGKALPGAGTSKTFIDMARIVQKDTRLNADELDDLEVYGEEPEEGDDK